MSINLQSTKDIAVNGVKLLVYGAAGAGKTTLIGTLPSPVVLSAEAGLLSLRGLEIPYLEIATMADLEEAYMWALSPEAEQFESICLDSISELAEVILNAEKKLNKDPRAAYGAMQEQVSDLIRAFRDIKGKNVYFSAKMEKSTDEQGKILYAPSMPGNKMAQQLPYFFDEVLALRVEKDAEGVSHRGIMCDSDGLWAAKDRSGALDSWEAPDLGIIIKKIGGEL